MLVEKNGDVRTISAARKEKIRNESVRAYLRLDYYALQHVHFCLAGAVAVMDLSHCEITNLSNFLPEQVLARLSPTLSSMNLSHNRLSELPASISQLSNLTHLDVSRNQLENLPPSIALLDHLSALDLSGNPLGGIPLFVLNTGVGAILEYYSDILEGVTEVCLETKLLIVGEENVGKTSLINNLIGKRTQTLRCSSLPASGKEAPNVSTHGIDVIAFSLKGKMDSKQFRASSGVHVENPFPSRGIDRRRSSPYVPRRVAASLTLSGSPYRSAGPVLLREDRKKPEDSREQFTPPLSIPIGAASPAKLRWLYEAGGRTTPRRLSKDKTVYREVLLCNASDKKIELFLGMRLDSLYQKFIHQENGINRRTIKKNFKTIRQCFQATDLVEWMIRNTAITVRDLAVKVGSIFVQRNLIRRVLRSAKENFQDESSLYVILDAKQHSVDYLFHAYDFAGQKVYYPTHQFFLTPKAIYLIAFDLRMDISSSRLEHWLQSIQSRAGDSGVILIVGTHADDERFAGNETALAEALQAIEQEFCGRFPSIQNIYAISNKTGHAIEMIRERLVTAAQYLLQSIPPIPVKYRHLEKMMMAEKWKKPNLPLLQWNEVIDLGKFLDMDERTVTRAVKFLHNRGVITFFPSLLAADSAKQVVTLDPQWLTKCMGNLIGSGTEQSFVRNGIIKRENLHHVWKHPTFPPSIHDYLLRILGDIDVVFPVPNSDLILISCLLPEEAPEVGRWFLDREAELVRVYQVKFFPSGFFSRLLIRMLLLREAGATSRIKYWNTGLVLEYRDGTSVFIEQLTQQRDLIIRVRGIHNPVLVHACRDLFKSTIALLELFIRYWFHLDVVRLIPCPHCIVKLQDQREDLTNSTLASSKQIHFFPLSECINSASSNFPTLSCPCIELGEDPIQRINLSLLAPDLMLETLRSRFIDSDLLSNKRKIGEGAFGTVYQAEFEGKPIALKELTELHSGSVYEEFIREVSIMTDLHHDCLANLIGYSKNPLALVMEFAPHGNLYDYIHSSVAEISWKMVLQISLNIATALVFLHGMVPPIIHRDLKTPNILVYSLEESAAVKVKVADFGLSTKKWSQMQEENDSRDVQSRLNHFTMIQFSHNLGRSSLAGPRDP